MGLRLLGIFIIGISALSVSLAEKPVNHPAPSASFQLVVNQEVVHPGEIIEVAVSVTSDQPLDLVVWSMEFDSSSLELLEVVTTGLSRAAGYGRRKSPQTWVSRSSFTTGAGDFGGLAPGRESLCSSPLRTPVETEPRTREKFALHESGRSSRSPAHSRSADRQTPR